MIDADNDPGSPFWRFSLRFYRKPGVADACIALQDGCGVDVNILLFLLWLATERRCVRTAAVRELCARTAPWRNDVVAPLRTIRRRLKDGSALIERSAAEVFRARVKSLELASERLEQEALFALADGLATDDATTIDGAARVSLASYEDVSGCNFPAASVTLIEALTGELRPDAGWRR
jgi:uncharacterized protein (TIGR02444 family)